MEEPWLSTYAIVPDDKRKLFVNDLHQDVLAGFRGEHRMLSPSVYISVSPLVTWGLRNLLVKES